MRRRFSGDCYILRNSRVYRTRERTLATMNPEPRLNWLWQTGVFILENLNSVVTVEHQNIFLTNRLTRSSEYMRLRHAF